MLAGQTLAVWKIPPMANDDMQLDRRLRTLGICLLGLAASISVFASVPQRAVSPIASAASWGHDRASLIGLTPGFPPHLSQTACPQQTPPINSLGRHSFRRVFIFVEDTTPPSSDALKTARVEVPIQTQAPPSPASVPRRYAFASRSNRQRAP